LTTEQKRKAIKEGLAKLTEDNRKLFRHMYSNNPFKPTNDIVDEMNPTKLKWALVQVNNTLKKNGTRQG
jgi:hypothetical protein